MAAGLSLLAACGGETVKLFDPAVETGDPCVFQYTPAPGFQVNCARWNHTSEWKCAMPIVFENEVVESLFCSPAS